MRIQQGFIATLLITQSLFAAAKPRSDVQIEFDLGTRVGQCLIVKCQVFRGLVLTELPKTREPIIVSVDEALYGMRAVPTTVAVPYFDTDHPDYRDGLGSPALAWEGVKVSRNTQVTVVLALERALGANAGEPLLVTSDDKQTRIIRSLTEEALLLDRSPELLADAVASLSLVANPPLAGYLFEYIAMGRKMPPPDLSNSLLMALVDNRSVPVEVARSVVAIMLSNYDFSSDSSKGELIRKFAELAQKSEIQLAIAGFMGLANVAGTDKSVLGRMSPTTTAGLGGVYRKLVSEKKLTPEPSLDAMFGANRE